MIPNLCAPQEVWSSRIRPVFTDANGISAMAQAAQTVGGEEAYEILSALNKLGLIGCFESAMTIAGKELSQSSSTPTLNRRDLKLMMKLASAVFNGCSETHFTPAQLAMLLEAASVIHP